jgi:D-alanyl-D-alanine carboxypeptidase
LIIVVLVLAFAGRLVGATLTSSDDLGDGDGPEPIPLAVSPGTAVIPLEQQSGEPPSAIATRFEPVPISEPPPVVHEFSSPPRAGLMFDVASGEILWERHPDRELPIASLTKMMTAWMIAGEHDPDEKVLISKEATKTGGSAVGVLPAGKKVPLGALLKGLLLVSGNDAATALAEDDAGSVERFVRKMNEEAERLGLDCSHFSSPHGLEDRGNYSCPRDLATLARADLSNARIRGIARIDHVRLPFPIKGGVLELWNNNPFIQAGDPTITGLKTGYTDAAGRCYVTTANRGGRELGVILLDSPNPLVQVPKLLELGAEA